MRDVTAIAAGDGFSLSRVAMRATSGAWSDPDLPSSGYRLVFVRSGVFRARVGDHVLLADPATAYLGGPDEEQSIAHRVGREDVCTEVQLSEGFVCELAGEAPPPGPSFPVSGDLAVAHRLLIARARRHADSFEPREDSFEPCIDSFHLAEMTVRLVGGLLRARWPAMGRRGGRAPRRLGVTWRRPPGDCWRRTRSRSDCGTSLSGSVARLII